MRTGLLYLICCLTLAAAWPVSAQDAQAQNAVSLEQRMIGICERVRPSVVCIEAKPKWAGKFGGSETTYYSGVVFDRNGHILTMFQAVHGASEIVVRTCDGRRLPGNIIGVDDRTDTAIVKVEDESLRPIPIGSSKDVKVGSWVLAVGNPFGLICSVSYGIVSGTDRTVETGDYPLYGMIQITAPVNPGDTGGAVVNSRGELIGIIHSTFGRGPSFLGMGHALWAAPHVPLRTPFDGSPIAAEGINFAAPIDRVKHVAEQLIKHGKPHRGWLGVGIRSVTPEMSEEERQSATHGVMVVKVLRDSPASRAGLQPGDVITDIEGESIRDVKHAVDVISNSDAGREVEIALIRGGEQAKLRATLSTEPEHPEEYVRPLRELAHFLRDGLLGAELRDLTPPVSQDLGVEKGVLVVSVLPDSPADLSGLCPGDVITKAGGQPIATRDDLVRIMRERLRAGAATEFGMEVSRNGKKVTILWR